MTITFIISRESYYDIGDSTLSSSWWEGPEDIQENPWDLYPERNHPWFFGPDSGHQLLIEMGNSIHMWTITPYFIDDNNNKIEFSPITVTDVNLILSILHYTSKSSGVVF